MNASWPGFCCLSVHRAHLPEQKLQRPFRWACSAAKQDGPQAWVADAQFPQLNSDGLPRNFRPEAGAMSGCRFHRMYFVDA